MNILIAGASGFIGRHLVKHWSSHKLVLLGRDCSKLQAIFPDFETISWDQLDLIKPSDFDAVINLSGETINHLRWTRSNKHKIIESRVKSTTALANWCSKDNEKKIHFLSVSGVSVYGLDDAITNQPYTEESLIIPTDQFMQVVALKCEAAAKIAEQNDIATTIMRFAVVFDKEEGALPKMLLPFKLFMGGVIGLGKQPIAFISIYDLVHAIDFILNHSIKGVVNLSAPEALTQEQFAKAISQALHRSLIFRIPAAVCKLFFGEMGEELLLKGQYVYPAVLLNNGFRFRDSSVEIALSNLGVAKRAA